VEPDAIVEVINAAQGEHAAAQAEIDNTPAPDLEARHPHGLSAYGVDLWVPELGGRFDPRNPSHKMLMSVLGGMSESERQHVQARVRAAMDSQVINEGRHQGGRAQFAVCGPAGLTRRGPRHGGTARHVLARGVHPTAAVEDLDQLLVRLAHGQARCAAGEEHCRDLPGPDIGDGADAAGQRGPHDAHQGHRAQQQRHADHGNRPGRGPDPHRARRRDSPRRHPPDNR
jgi:hypothetical protein